MSGNSERPRKTGEVSYDDYYERLFELADYVIAQLEEHELIGHLRTVDSIVTFSRMVGVYMLSRDMTYFARLVRTRIADRYGVGVAYP